MVKIVQISIPSEYEPLLAKILAWFDPFLYNLGGLVEQTDAPITYSIFQRILLTL